jgi:hypothetical protein
LTDHRRQTEDKDGGRTKSSQLSKGGSGDGHEENDKGKSNKKAGQDFQVLPWKMPLW